LECGINRVFVRSTRKAGPFTLTVFREGLTPASVTIHSTEVEVKNGLMTQTPAVYSVTPGKEPVPMKALGFAGELGTGSAATAIAPANTAAPATSAPAMSASELITNFAYSGAHADAVVAHNAQKGAKVYKDSNVTFGDLPSYLLGADYIQSYLADAGETSSTDQYQFDLLKPSFVYLLIDSANDMPVNNDNEAYKWQKLPEKVTINSRAMVVYRSRLMQPKDNVYLATNGHGISRFDMKSNMYLVLVAGNSGL
jgi:hypothetical protein